MRLAIRLKLIKVPMLVALMQIALTLRLIKDIVACAMKGSKETPISKKDAKVNWLLIFGMISNIRTCKYAFAGYLLSMFVSRHVYSVVLIFFLFFSGIL
jgi:hypothetical protein